MDKWLEQYVEQVMDQQVENNGIFKRRKKREA